MTTSRVLQRFSGLLIGVALCCVPYGLAEAEITSSFRAPLPDLAMLVRGSAMKNANLSPTACRAALKAQGIAHKRVYGGAPGIATPLRLTEPINGVKFITAGPKSVFSLLDCRLALSMQELTQLLARHGVAEIRVDSFYRTKARLYGRKRGKLSQHAYGLAMDVTAFKLNDGRTLDVERDFQGKLGDPVCGAEANLAVPTPEATLLRNIVCAIASSGIFHNLLTPNYNTAHRNHFHFDITRDAKTIGVR